MNHISSYNIQTIQLLECILAPKYMFYSRSICTHVKVDEILDEWWMVTYWYSFHSEANPCEYFFEIKTFNNIVILNIIVNLWNFVK